MYITVYVCTHVCRDRYLIDIPGVTPEALRGTISSILAHELGT